jgi:hypothetical protein
MFHLLFQQLTHIFTAFIHTFLGLNQGFDLRFYLFPTVLLSGYYYYLYIYKSRFQADHLQITVSSLITTNLVNVKTKIKPMSARATA